MRRILHCDMDCFYAAVHMRDDASLAGRPVVVGGDPAGRGVVAAASYEARHFGIHSAMPAAEAQRRCPEAVFIRPNFALYRRESERIFSIYREVTPLVETLSLDEAYLDVTEHLGRFGSATAVAAAIRRRVLETTRLTVSIGVGPSKLVAKIASDQNKPDGLTVVPPGKVQEFLDPLPVRRLYGVGPATTTALSELGVTTVMDLRALTLDRLLGRFGSHGRTLHAFARGIDDRPVRPHRPRKSLGAEETYRHDLRSLAEVDEQLELLAGEVSAGLRRRGLAATTVTLKVRYADFNTVTRSQSVPLAIWRAEELLRCARTLCERTEAGRRPLRLLGITASNLYPSALKQLDLFDPD
ncbi:MAG: DNA polymerase IV [Acidobacteria bacterium]|nr:DNA polymerase IV [Acidobacteriota bacterium]